LLVTIVWVYGGDVSSDPDRYEPLPSFAGLPAFLWRKLGRGGRRALVAGLVAAAAAAAVLVPAARRDAGDQARATERASRTEAAARRARIAREARPRTGTGPAAEGLAGRRALRARRALTARLEAGVLADARARAARGELRGRYRSSACFEFPKRLGTRPPSDDLRRAAATFECLAVSSRVAPDERTTGSLIGQPFRARVDFAAGRYAWCKIVQRPGELSIRRAELRVPRACGGPA